MHAQLHTLIHTQVCSGLAFMHARRLAHGDVKPDNVLLVSHESLEVKIADLGSTYAIPPGQVGVCIVELSLCLCA